MQLQPDALPSRRTAKPTTQEAAAPESTFEFEKQKLDKYEHELELQDFPTRLGVDITATEDEARKALIGKAKEFHPDNKPTELRPNYTRIFALLTQASNAYTGDTIKKTKVEREPTQFDRFRQTFMFYQTVNPGMSPKERFDAVKQEFLKKKTLTPADIDQLEATLLGKAA